MSALNRAYRELIAAGDNLSLMAQTSGGTAGRDDGIVAAIQKWQEAKNKVNQIARIERFEPAPGMVISAGLGAEPACVEEQPHDDCTNPVCVFREPRTASGSLD